MLKEKLQLLDEEEMGRILRRMACEIIEKNGGTDGLVIVGIQRRGVPLAERLAAYIEHEGEARPATGELDITLYRDDLSFTREQPLVRRTHIPGGVQGRNIYLVDDVVYTGRTTRAALDAVMDLGRAACIRLAVLIDRGQRELPINPDIVGKQIPTSKAEVIQVKVKEIDGKDMVILSERHN